MADSSIYTFSVDAPWTILGSYTTHVTVYNNKVDLFRKGRVSNLPEKVTIPFDKLSAITYSKDANYMLAHITFSGMSESRAQSFDSMQLGKLTLGSSSANPHFDPYRIIVKFSEYAKIKPHYERLAEIFQAYQQSHTADALTQNVIMSESALDKLKKLKELYDLGIITDSEYNDKREKLLAEI